MFCEHKGIIPNFEETLVCFKNEIRLPKNQLGTQKFRPLETFFANFRNLNFNKALLARLYCKLKL